MKKITALIFCLSLIISMSEAYDNEVVHQLINEKAANQSSNLLRELSNLGFNDGVDSIVHGKKIYRWFHEGARLEDETVCRSRNHFHDPLKSWDSAGLNNEAVNSACLLLGFEGFSVESSVIWAQKQSVNPWYDNLWSWPKARQSYYRALTLDDKNLKERYFAETLRSLGQVMHLLADSSVPAHVRNDIHVFPLTVPGVGIEVGSQTYESWAKQNHHRLSFTGFSVDNSSFNLSVPNASAPVAISALWDQDKYDGSGIAQTIGTNIGLAEYANANFFSEDTIFRDYPHPTYSDTNYLSAYIQPEVIDAEDGKFDNRVYIKKTVGDADARLASFSYISYDLIKKGYYNSSPFVLDDKVYNDYAALLIPRAVGYSAALLDYFFRGTLEISAPDTYIYSITDGSAVPHQFSRIKAKVKNITLNEALQAGILQAVARYKMIPNYAPDLSNYPPDGTAMKEIPYSYSVSLPIALMSEQLASMNIYPTEFTFDFTGNPIPAGITDLSLQVIFRGTLGNEVDTAVAVGMKDLMEPTHHVFWNLTDMFSLDGHLYTAAEIRADPELLDRAAGEHIDPYPINFEISYMPESPPASPPVVLARAANLPEGRYIRLITLVDNELTDNYVRLVFSSDIDATAETVDFAFEGVVNQETEGVWQPPTPSVSFRRAIGHFYIGILRCKPMSIDPVTGYSYCPYPESEAYPADLTPYPALMSFP